MENINRTNIFPQILTIIVNILISIFLLPMLLAFIAIFASMRFLANFAILIKYKRKYGGMIEGTGSVFAAEDTYTRNVINILIIVNFGDRDSEYVMQAVKSTIYEKFFHDPKKFPTLASVRHLFFGYHFFLRDQYTVNDCVKALPFDGSSEDVIEESDLEDYISLFSNRPLPKNNKALWEVMVGSKPVFWKSEQKILYPIVVRIHHSLMDGVSLVKLLLSSLADDLASFDHDHDQLKNEKITHRDDLDPYDEAKWSLLKNIRMVISDSLRLFLKTSYNVCCIPEFMVRQCVEKNDRNILHGSRLSGDKITVWTVENRRLVEMVKNIKNSVDGWTFSEVILTAVSASLADYFKKKTGNVPEYVNIVIPAMYKPNRLSNITLEYKHIFRNTFTAAQLCLPINMAEHTESSLVDSPQRSFDNLPNDSPFRQNPEVSPRSMTALLLPKYVSVSTSSKSVRKPPSENNISTSDVRLPIVVGDSPMKSSLLQRCERVHQTFTMLKNSPQFQINYWILTIVAAVLPEPILKLFVASVQRSTLILSNLPGSGIISVFNGHLLHDIVFWPPNCTSTGLSLSILTYDGRFQLGLMVDKVLISSKSEAQDILNNVFKYIKLLNEEIDQFLTLQSTS